MKHNINRDNIFNQDQNLIFDPGNVFLWIEKFLKKEIKKFKERQS